MTIIEETYNWARTPARRKKTEVIILHHAAGHGTEQDIHRRHLAQGWPGIGYHFYVRQSGEICRGRPEDRVGTHTANHNSNSIGICFEGNFEQETMCAAQYEAGVELLGYLAGKYGELPILRHRDYNATACPGRNFPFEQMKEDIVARYNKLKDIPDKYHFRDIIDMLMTAGVINGDGSDANGNNDVIDLSHDMVRMLIFNYNAGCYDEAIRAAGCDPEVYR